MTKIQEKEKVNCSDIYKEEIEKSIKTFKRFREFWLDSKFNMNSELFKYADDDFYFYRFAIDREERNKITLLNSIMYRLLSRYQYDFEVPDNHIDAPFDFIINTNHTRIGYKFEDYFDNINDDLQAYNVNKLYIIRTIKGNDSSFLKNYNNMFEINGINAEMITIQTLFTNLCSENEFIEFEKNIKNYIKQTKDILGYQSIKLLSNMNLSAQKVFEEKILRDWDYENSKYQIINRNNKIESFLYLNNYNFKALWLQIKNNYINNDVYKTMIGYENYAESFITSEWLYYSLNGKDNFDYTSIVSGYLKSIEQLLYKIVMVNVNNNCVISLKADKDIKSEVINKGITVYEMKNYKRLVAKSGWERWLKYPYIDFIDSQIEYMDSSIGTFEYFLRNNEHIFVEPKFSKVICDMISCFRTECRNGYFHTHNLHDTTIVDKTRENAILLYAILLGSIKNINNKKDELGIDFEDRFDSLCKEIREIRRFSPDFIFEYEDGTKKNMIYDFLNNTPEFNEYGHEHYEHLIFYEVKDFSIETYEMLDTDRKDDLIHLLTRNNIPKRIYCYDINKNIHEIKIK